MTVILASAASQIGQLLAVLLIFVLVLVLTAVCTRWIANYQKDKAPGENITVVESKRVALNKYVEIVRIGDRYFAIAVGKDEVSFISEVSADSLHFPQTEGETFSFKQFLNRAKDNGDK